MKHFSTISADEKQRLKKEGIAGKHYMHALKELSPDKITAPVCKINVMHYIDKHGDFFSNKTPTAKIVKAIYNSLEPADQQACMFYLMDNTED